jgi:hypothetical protein
MIGLDHRNFVLKAASKAASFNARTLDSPSAEQPKKPNLFFCLPPPDYPQCGNLNHGFYQLKTQNPYINSKTRIRESNYTEISE